LSIQENVMTRYARNSLPAMFGLLLASAPAPFVGGDGYYAGGFGNYASGRTLLDFGEPDPQSADANAMAMLPDGSFVIAGSRTGGTSFFHMAAAHVGATGTHDLAFGSGGVVTFDPPGSYLSSANAIVHQSSGKTILVGTANYGTLGNSNGDFSACRLTLSGTLDPTYGIDGCSRQGFDAGATNDYDEALAAAIDDLGRVIVAGSVMNDPDDVERSKFGIVRLDGGGGLDTSFGDNGRTLILRFDEIAGAPTTERVQSIAIAPDGRIVIGGTSRRSDSSQSHFAVARLDADGHLDTAFGDAGVVQELPVPVSFLDARSLAFQSDGSLIVGGNTQYSTDSVHMAAIRLTPQGVVDATFGSNGFRLIRYFLDPPNRDSCNAIAVQPDDKILVAGTVTDIGQSPARQKLAMTRLLPDGAFDTAFGNADSGFLDDFYLKNTGSNSSHALTAVTVQDSRIVAVGNAPRNDEANAHDRFIAIALTRDRIFADGFDPLF
jgi:uncharacterized delta-60 repeat protein